MMRHRRTAAVALATVIPAAVVLSGCATIDEFVHNERSWEFAGASELATGWGGHADWVPDDAGDIRIRESTSGDVAALVLVSDSALDPALCAQVERLSGPAFEVEGTPDPFRVADAFACADWTVIATDDGWFGWTPNHPDEAAQSPS